MVSVTENLQLRGVINIAIIGDERDLAELFAYNLEKEEGYQTFLVRDGRSGFERVTSECPGLFFGEVGKAR